MSSAAGPLRAGSLDPSFGSGGVVTYSPASASNPSISAIATQSDAKIVVAAGSVIARYLPNGLPDPGFGTGGYVETAVGDYADAVAVQPNGKIVVAGTRVMDDGGSEFMVERYMPHGSPDTSFGTDGVTTTVPPDPPGGYPPLFESDIRAVAVLPTGKIVVAGSAVEGDDSGGGIDGVFALVRYTPHGALDTTFGDGGIVETGFTHGYDKLGGIAVLSSGKIVATGAGYGWGHGEEVRTMVLARYKPNGSLDPTFGTSHPGTTITPPALAKVGGPPALQSGKILVAGSALARFTASGRLDTTFGTHGFVKIAGSAVVTQADGKILLAAGKSLVRLLPNGPRDTSFGARGVVSLRDPASSLTRQVDGKILVGEGSAYSWTLARLIGQMKTGPAFLEWSASSGGAHLTSSVFRAVDGTAHVSRGLTLESPGLTQSGTLAISVTGSSAFSVTSDTCTGKSINESLSCSLGVTYAPLGDGASDSAMLTAIGEGGAATRLSLTGCSGGRSRHVYWVNSGDTGSWNGTVNAVWRGGGCVTTLAGGQANLEVLGNPSRPAADGAHVYWSTSDGKVNEAPIGGGPVTTLATGQGSPSVAVDGTYVYWTNNNDRTVRKAPVGGGPVTIIATGQGAGSVGVNGTYVYWATGDTVNAVPIGGGAVTTLATIPRARSFAVDATHVYWVTDDGNVKEVPIGGGPVTTLASSQNLLLAVAVDGTNVYWIDYGPWSPSSGWDHGTVNEVPIGGGPVTPLASGQREPLSLAVDDTNVYWANYDGTVKDVSVGGGTVHTLARGQGHYLTVAVGP